MSEHAEWEGSDYTGRVRVLMPDMYDKYEWSFFRTYEGNSWHGKDARFIFWMGRNWVLLTVVGFAVAGIVFLAGWFVYRRVIGWGKRRKGSVNGSPKLYAKRGGPMVLWRTWSSRGKSASYEMVAQHDA